MSKENRSNLKKELVKPKKSEERLMKEVETLCNSEQAACGSLRRCGAYTSTDEPGSENDILF